MDYSLLREIIDNRKITYDIFVKKKQMSFVNYFILHRIFFNLAVWLQMTFYVRK